MESNKDYIIKEAEAILANCSLKYDKQTGNSSIRKIKKIKCIEKKYKFIKTINKILLITLIISVLFNFI